MTATFPHFMQTFPKGFLPMGNYRIVVEGIGAHHNERRGATDNTAGDADDIARAMVGELVGKGHSVSRADITVEGSDGGRLESLLNEDGEKSRIYKRPPDLPRRVQGVDILRYFDAGHLPEPMRSVSRHFCDLARWIVATVPNNAERSTALRKLLEAKDAAVRAVLPAEPAQQNADA